MIPEEEKVIYLAPILPHQPPSPLPPLPTRPPPTHTFTINHIAVSGIFARWKTVVDTVMRLPLPGLKHSFPQLLGVLVTDFSQLSPFPETSHSWRETLLPKTTSPFLAQPVSND